MQIVIFALKGKQYAIETDHIEEISELLDETFIPNAPDYIKGLINLRGNVITLIDISKLLGLESKQENYTKIIITKMNKELIAILVGEVYEVMDIEEDRIEKVNLEEAHQGLKGIIQIQDRIINYLDLESYLSLE